MSNNTRTNHLTDHPMAVLAVAIASICLGIFFIVFPKDNKPIPWEEAVFHSGEFAKYESSDRYCTIYFRDGSCYSVYPHTESREFRDAMKALPEGTKLDIAVNPNNEYVVEVKTETGELLNFSLSQEEIYSYSNGYIAIGCIACACGVFLLLYVIASTIYKRKEKKRKSAREAQACDAETDSAVLRYAEGATGRILLEATVQGYTICYRRVRSVNELVINGRVYDEKKGIIEFEHALYATLDGHTIEAGYDKDSFSYILFDGEMVARKRRLI